MVVQGNCFGMSYHIWANEGIGHGGTAQPADMANSGSLRHVVYTSHPADEQHAATDCDHSVPRVHHADDPVQVRGFASGLLEGVNSQMAVKRGRDIIHGSPVM